MAAEDKDLHRDPITNEPGAHPVGTGIGAAGGAVAGAAAGAIGGPVGMAVGGVVGAIVGGLAGKAAAEAIDPTAEEAHWRDTYEREPYYEQGRNFDDYAPAYRLGMSGRTTHEGDWDSAEPRLASEWENARAGSSLSWDQARPASRAAWDRVDSLASGMGSDNTSRYSTSSYDTQQGGVNQNMGSAGMNSQDLAMRGEGVGLGAGSTGMATDTTMDERRRADMDMDSMRGGMGSDATRSDMGRSDMGMTSQRMDTGTMSQSMEPAGMSQGMGTTGSGYGVDTGRDGSGAAGAVGAMQSAGNEGGDRDDVIDVLQDLAECSLDGEYGFQSCAEQAQSAELKSMFMQRADDCRRAVQELNDQIRACGGRVEEHGSAAGAMHRGWVAVKSALSTYDDKAVLEECERGEDNAMARYRKALKSPLPAGVKLVVERQMQGVQRNHDQIKMLRDQYRDRS